MIREWYCAKHRVTLRSATKPGLLILVEHHKRKMHEVRS